MKAGFAWHGLAEFRALLRQLPADVRGEADHLVQEAANTAGVRIRTNYGLHRHTGNLQASVRVTHRPTRYGLRSTVRTTAPHAHLFEYGTGARQTSQGAYRGVMPPAPPLHAFHPVVAQEQRILYARLADVLRRHGLQVGGDAAA